MDAQIVGNIGNPAEMPTVDLYVPPAATGQHIVPILTGDLEEQQQAELAAFILAGAVRQASNAAVDWIGYLAGDGDNFGELNAQVLQALTDAGRTDYYPDYDIVDGQIVVNVTKREGS